ncbi:MULTISPECIES: hypothetical protein [unclassified Thermosynechococcus]|uniref:hypothetical protein n=1 Tax=unclassified Thermosynechococcus TaxID=2622553 RepID=UPI0019F738D1|nr:MULTISPECIES: hypothetical protein [unclassified Thermosynechococcus]HIK34135.1 hypothetical protein [Thermosynechococcus sp. M98_K2018_005]HIK48575.1 hypothetical protein [Thermosynechococcus sp. M55_K2018_012]
MKGWQVCWQRAIAVVLGIILLWSVGDRAAAKSSGSLAEVAPPVAIEDMKDWFDRYEPRLKILSPEANQTLQSRNVTVKLSVQGLRLFQDQRTGLGPHVEVVLDDLPSRSVYDLNTPIEFTNLEPGTHLLRAFVVYPWGESLKNPLAYAQTTFHLYTADEDTRAAHLPLLTYNQPSGTYGAEPVLLDFYLSNLPLDRQFNNENVWQVRCTINGQSFTVDRWQAYYLTGLQPGDNWVRLELLDGNGQRIPSPYNPITHLVTYQPNGKDVLSRLLRGELAAKNLQSSLSPELPSNLPPEPTPEPSPVVEEPTTAPKAPVAQESAPTSTAEEGPLTVERVEQAPLAPEPTPEPTVKATEETPSAPEPTVKATEETPPAPEPTVKATEETPPAPEPTVKATPKATETPPSAPASTPQKPFWQRLNPFKKFKKADSPARSVLISPRVLSKPSPSVDEPTPAVTGPETAPTPEDLPQLEEPTTPQE